MFKNLSVMEVKAAEERIHSYQCPPNSPLGEVHDSLRSMLGYVIQQMQAQQDADEPKEEEKKEEEVQECKEACADSKPEEAA